MNQATQADLDPDPGIGIAGELADDEGPEAPVTAGSLVRWVIRRQRGRIVAGALAGIAWMGSIAILPVALGYSIDRIVDDRSVGSVSLVCALLFVVTMAQAVAGVIRHRCALLLYTRTRWLVERLVTRRVLDPRGGVDVEPGALLSLAASDAQRVGGIADLMCRGSGAIVSFFAVGAGMLAASPILGGLVLVGLPPCLLVLVPLWRPYDRRATEQQQRLADASAVAADITTGLRVVKGLGSEDGVRRWFAEGTAQVRTSAIALARLDSAWKALAAVIPALFLALTIWVGGRLALDGTLSAGALVTFTGLALFLTIPLQTFAEVGDVWATGLASARRIAIVLATPPSVDDTHLQTPATATARFESISHGPLSDFALDVADGEILGVVAEDPEVAVAIADLLVRRADPERGRVFVGGVDARELSLDALRAHIVTVDGHHPWLVDGTLGENLALGAPDADPTTLKRALLHAAGEDLLSRRNGIEQPIGERGLSLSGGQRQRLTVARSYAASPPVLVLDEPTSALDVVTELRLLSRLRGARAGRHHGAADDQRTRARSVRPGGGRRQRPGRVARPARRVAPRLALSGSRGAMTDVTATATPTTVDHALPTATPKAARARMLRLLRDRWRGVTVTVALQSASTIATLAGPALVGVVVDAVANDSPNARSTVDRAALAYAVLAIVAAVLRYFGGVRAAVVGEDSLAEMRKEVFDHALAVPVDLVERAGTGDLVSRVTSDITILADAVRNSIPIVLLAVLQVSFTVVALLVLDLRLAAIALVTAVPITLLAGQWYFRRAHTLYRRERERHAALGAGLHESYQGTAVLAGFRAGPRTRRGLARRGRITVDAEMATTSARNRMRPGISLAQAVSLVAVMAAGSALVDNGTIEIGTLSAAALYLVQLFNPVATLLEQTDQMQRSTASFARLVGVTQLPADRPAGKVSEPPERSTTAVGVHVDDVVFGYDEGTLVLDGINLDIAPGERLAIVGPSGAGKTTLGKIIAGLLHTSRGGVEVGGVVVDELEPHARARVVAMVAQEGHVFGRSVSENVRLGRPDATEHDVRAALDAVDALAWAEALPEGLDTRIGFGHQPVSTTRAQQLALARLVCLDPAVVVLDEATAELDPVAAARTERHLHAALGERTVVTIVHRLDVAERADRIIVLEDGRIVASGHHTELIADPEAAYAQLWQSWSASRIEGAVTEAG